MTNRTPFPSLAAVADRIALVVIELNGLISSIVNEEATLSDFDDDLKTELIAKLDQVEAVVGELADVFWQNS